MPVPPDPLWQSRNDRTRPLRCRLAGLVWAYEHAPLRRILIGPEGLYLIDGLCVAAARALVAQSVATVPAIPPEPSSSGWVGNLVFLTGWLLVLAAIVGLARTGGL